MTMETLRSELDRLKTLETQLLDQAKWAESPRGVDDSLIHRYEKARDLYLQRRLENLLVDHIATYQPDEEEPFELPSVDDEEEAQALDQRHSKALATLQTSMDHIQSQVTKLKATKEAVVSRRQELEQMIQDMEDDDDNDDDDDDESMEDDNDTLDESDIATEQERIEQLQLQKIKLQEELEKIKLETKQVQQRARRKEEQLATLQVPQNDLEQKKQKLKELQEMKAFYENLLEVVEELGGVKIVKVEEDVIKNHLILTLLFYDEYQVQVELEVFRKVFLKLVHAKWISEPVVHPTAIDTGNDNDGALQDSRNNKDDFALAMDSLDDLVQVAKSTLSPPHDLRFLVGETLARIRITQARVEDLTILRRHVLTKVHGTTQVVCSLNEGIVIVVRLYEKFLRLDQIVGIGGWDADTTKKLQTAVVERLEKEYPQEDAEILLFGSNVTPLMIVQYVQDELAKLQAEEGFQNPTTPRFPERKKGGF